MTETTRRLLDAFESLPEAERHEVAREILRLTALAQHGPLTDDELLVLADEVLRDLDRNEIAR